MANGFGLNAAVQAFPSAYEFGRSLVGQDNASLDRAFKEKALAAEMAMKQQQMEDEAAYKAGVLRNTDYANRTQRMEADSLGNYRGIQGQVLAEGAPYENRERAARTNRIEQMLPVELQDAQSEIASRNDQNRRANEMHPLEMAGKRVNTTYMTNAARQMGQSADAQELKNQEWEAEDRYGKVLPKIISDPYDPSISPEDRRRALAEAGVMANPHAERAVQLFDAATAHYQKTGKQDMFNDELRLEMGKALQPLIDQNTGSAPGSFRFAGFEPAEGGGVRMKLAKVDPKSGQPLSTENLYVTDGRVPMADGGVPSVFTPSDVHHVLSGLRSAADWQKANPEVADQMWAMTRAHAGTHDPVVYAKNLASMEEARAKATGDATKLEETQRRNAERTRNAMTAKFIQRLDEMAGFDSKDFVDVDADGNKTRNTAEIQKARQARQEAIQEFRAQINQMPYDRLLETDVDTAIGTPVMQEAIAPYLARSRRSPSGSSYTPPTQGGIQNSPAYGTPAAGGRPSPFKPTAFRSGGGAVPMPANLQITGSAKRFGVEKVDPSLLEGVKAAAQLWPGKVDLFSSGRDKKKGEKGNHSSWHALDVGLITPEGTYLPNHIKKKWHGGGSGAAHEYERFWQAAVLWAAQDDPSILERFRWGGNFREQDYMHGDTLRGVGGKGTGAGTLFGGRDTRYGGGKTMPVKDLNALGRELYGNAWRGIPGLPRQA